MGIGSAHMRTCPDEPDRTSGPETGMEWHLRPPIAGQLTSVPIGHAAGSALLVVDPKTVRHTFTKGPNPVPTAARTRTARVRRSASRSRRGTRRSSAATSSSRSWTRDWVDTAFMMRLLAERAFVETQGPVRHDGTLGNMAAPGYAARSLAAVQTGTGRRRRARIEFEHEYRP